MSGRRVLVCGGREFQDFRLLDNTLTALHFASPIGLIITGGAMGADNLAASWGNTCDVDVEIVRADWKQHGRAAGPIRNRKMLEHHPDIVVAFPGGKGTADMVKQARAAGIEVQEVLAARLLEGNQ